MMTGQGVQCRIDILGAFLRGKACFIMTRQKCAKLLHYYMGNPGFLMTRPKARCIFDAL